MPLPLRTPYTQRSNLRTKWLDESDGDIAKAATILAEARAADPDLNPVLILTTSLEPSDDVLTDVEKKASQLGIEIDVWSNARLAHTLDTSPDGQWVRRKYLGQPQARLSQTLAIEISHRMLNEHQPPINPDEAVSRRILAKVRQTLNTRRGVLFLSGDSGVGKSALCFDLGRSVLEDGGGIFVLTHEILQAASTLAEAVTSCLKSYEPDLKSGNLLAHLIEMCADNPLVFWVEDVNKAPGPADLVQKLLRWAASSGSTAGGEKASTGTASWLILCPVWPQHLSFHRKDIRDRIDEASIHLSVFDETEGRAAVKARAARVGLTFTDVTADAVSVSLGHDPLLIGLVTDWSDIRAAHVIADYIGNGLACMAGRSSHTASDGHAALTFLSGHILKSKTLTPSWVDICNAQPEGGTIRVLSALADERSIISLRGAAHEQYVVFRHDRVRDHLLAERIAADLRSGCLLPAILSDPFFARLVGEALSQDGIDAEHIELVRKHSPLALFAGLGPAKAVSPERRNSLAAACRAYLDNTDVASLPQALLNEINWTLADQDGSDILDLIDTLPGPSRAKLEARMRNGDVCAAAAYCLTDDPFVISFRRDGLIAHARQSFGATWLNDLKDLIADPDITDDRLTGVLYLAGELAEVSIAPAISERWHHEKAAGAGLSAALLFAAVSCGAGVDGFPMDEVMEAWATLPDEDPENNHRSPRHDTARDGLHGGLRRIGDDRTISVLISAADQYGALRGSVYGCLEHIDHPLAVTYAAAYVAGIDKEIEGKDGYHNTVGLHALQIWDASDSYGTQLSPESRAALEAVWSNESRLQADRRRAFELWAATLDADDIDRLRENSPAGLENYALKARLRHGDQTAKGALSAKLESGEKNSYWLQYCRYVGTEGLETEIERRLEARRAAFLADPNRDHWPDDWHLADLLGDRDDVFARDIITRHWDHLSGQNCYVQALLYLADPNTLSLVEEAVTESDDPKKLFEHLHFQFGLKTFRRPGITGLAQLEALRPYFGHLGRISLSDVWDVCNDLGQFDWRRTHLDPLISKEDRPYEFTGQDAAFASLDDLLANDRDTDGGVYFWARRRLEAGESADEVVNLAYEFYNVRKTDKSLRLFCWVISEHGRRTHLPLLDIDRTGRPPEIIRRVESARFAVRKRTLA